MAAGRHPLGPQVTPAPRAVPGAGRDLPRRHLRRHPPRPGVGDRVHGDDDRLHGPSHPRPGGRRGDRATTGPTASSGCCAAAPRSTTSSRQTRPSTSTSTSSWPTTWPWWRAVYDVADQPLDRSSRDAMAAFMAEHPRGKFGAIDYDLTEFGLDPRRAPKGALVLHRALRRDARVVGLSPTASGRISG